MNSTNDRLELIATAKELMLELRKISVSVRDIVAKLNTQADILLPNAADEKQFANEKKVKPVAYDQMEMKIEKDIPIIDESKTYKRACSICRKPGHRAQNCPQYKERFK